MLTCMDCHITAPQFFHWWRYVDDLIAVPFVLCRTCLAQQVKAIYTDHSDFEDAGSYEQSGTYLICTYLDVLSSQVSHATYFNTNEMDSVRLQ